MESRYEAVIGLEVHAELQTRSKMFCGCPVVDLNVAPPNSAVCPICSGMPGVLPMVNRRAVEYALRVALALECEIASTSIFARKNYFYPDLPKGYQISQYEHPLARNGWMRFFHGEDQKTVRIRRVHLEEDTGKLTHLNGGEGAATLVDLNRAGVPLLEIVSEPELRSAAEVRAYAIALRSLLRYLGVNAGDMQKGLLRIEPNVSVRLLEEKSLGDRVEIKNLNSFRALERSVEFEIRRQIRVLEDGERVRQETVGWDEVRQVTVPQRVKESEHDYRYFPEPDLPPLVVDEAWVEAVRAALPELPGAKLVRFREQYGLRFNDARVLVAEREVADYFEALVAAAPRVAPQTAAHWVTGELFGLMNQAGETLEDVRVSPRDLAGLLALLEEGRINNNTAKAVLAEMYVEGGRAADIVSERGLEQITDSGEIAGLVAGVLAGNPEQVASHRAGNTAVSGWLFGQVMRAAEGRADPQVVRQELDRQLGAPKP